MAIKNPARADPGRVLEILGCEKRLVVSRIAVVRACRRNACYRGCYRRYDARCGSGRTASASRSGARGCTTGLGYRIARDHRKENHRY